MTPKRLADIGSRESLGERVTEYLKDFPASERMERYGVCREWLTLVIESETSKLCVNCGSVGNVYRCAACDVLVNL
jgi:hypothetical protein